MASVLPTALVAGASNRDAIRYSNPNPAGVPLNDSSNMAPDSASSPDAVTWRTEPVIEAGTMVAAVAPSEFEQEGNEFTIRAYSPLLMDVGPSDLLLRVRGYDNAGNAALPSVRTVDARDR